MTSDLRIQGEVVVNSEKAESAFNRVGDKATQMANEVATSAGKAGQAVDKIGDGAGASAEKFTRAESRMSAAIKKATNELELLGKTASQRLEFNIADKGLDAAKFEPALKKLRELEAQAQAAQRAASGSLDGMGMSAKQTAAALRQVPMQFTDIIVSLQGGQSAMQVFLQQGGQLKDMFGGAGAAARALGGYVLGLVNPFTIAAATVAGIAVAYNQGRKEAEAFNKTLILSGNAAGTSADSLSDMARAIDATSNGITQSKAAEVLNSIAASGDVASDKLQRYAQVAIEFERAGGGAADEVAKAFSSMAGDPLAAVEKLNKSTNFLTAEIYNQIKALEDEGRSTDAARVAQDAYASMLEQRIPKLKDNLGLLERGWMGVKDAAAEAWDAMLNVGRAQTIGGRLEAAQKLLADYESTLPGKRTTEQVARVAEAGGVNGLRSQIAGLQELMETQRKADEQQRANNQSTQAAINLSKQASQFDDDLEKQRKAVAQATELYTTALAAGNLSESARAQLEKDYLKTVTGITAAKEQRATSTRKENKDLADQSRIFAELAGVSSTYYTELAAAQAQRAKGNISEAQYIAYVEELIQKQPFAVALVKAETEARKEFLQIAEQERQQRLKIAQAAEQSVDSLATGNQKLRDEIQLIGLSATEQMEVLRLREESVLLVKEQHLAEMKRAEDMTGTMTRERIALEQEIDARRELLGLIGSKEAREANKRAAEEAAKDWERTAQTISDTLADYIMSGGKDAAQYLERLFATLVLQPVVQYGVNGVMGMMGMAPSVAGAASGGSNILGTASNLGSLGAFGGTVSAGLSYGATSLFANGLGTTLAAGGQMIGAGSIVSGISTIAGALGPIALGVGALTSLISSLDDSGTPHAGAGAVYSGGKVTGGRDVYSYDRFDLADMNTYSDQVQGLVSPVAQSIGAALDAFATAFVQQAGYTVSTAFADDSSKDASWGALRIEDTLGQVLVDWNSDRQSKWAPREFSDGEQGQKEYLAAIARDTRQVLLDMDLPSWADEILESIGDTADMDALTAAMTQIGKVQTSFEQLGASMQMFAGITDELQAALMGAAGGIDALVNSAGAFYQGFYTEAERMDALRGQLNTALSGLDLTIDPNMGDDAKAQFRQAVEDAMAAGDAELAASLLAISGNFATAADYFEQLSRDAAEAAKKSADDARKALIDSTYDMFKRAVDRDRDLLSSQASAISEVIGQIGTSVDMLKSNARELYGQVDGTAQMLAAQGMVYIEQALAGVRAGGSLTDYAGLQDAIGAARGGINAGAYASEFERKRDTLILAGQLGELGELGQAQLTFEDRQLKALNAQIDALDVLGKRADDLVNGTAGLTETVQTYFDSLMALLAPEEKPGASKPGQGGAVFGGTSPGGSFGPAAGADAKYSQVMSGGSSGAVWYQGITDESMIDRLDKLAPIYHGFDGTGDLAGLAAAIKAAGGTVDDLSILSGNFASDWRKALAGAGIPAFAGGGMHFGGLRLVGERGPEIEATGPARIWNQQQLGQALGGGNAEMLAEMRALRAEVAQLRQAADATAGHTAGLPQLVDQFDNVTEGGNAMRVEVMA